MTEEKKAQIRRRIWITELVLASLMIIYLVYVIATKQSNSMLFNIIAAVILLSVFLLNDVVEPYLTQTLQELNDFRKKAYRLYVLCDGISYAGLLLFIMTFGTDENTAMFISICMYVVGSRKKKEHRAVYMGEVTEEDVAAAKEAVAESETVEVTETAEVEEIAETETVLEIEEKSIEE